MNRARHPMTNVSWRLPALFVIGLLGVAACDEGGFAEPEPDPTPPAGEGSPNPPTTPLGKTPSSLVIVSGGSQTEARVGEAAEPMVVRVTDERGIRVAGVPVNWRVSKGEARLVSTTTTTDTDGVTAAEVVIFALGPSVVEASVDGIARPVAFQVNATVQVIDIRSGTYLSASDRLPVAVPRGTLVEILNRDAEIHSVVTLSAPTRGNPLQAGSLAPGERFAFLPNVSGTWTFTCGIHDDEDVGELIVGDN